MRQPSRSTGELLAHDVTVFENGQLAVWPSRAQWAWALRRRPSSWVSTVPCLCTTEVTRLSDVQYTGEESAVLCLLVNVNIQHPWDTPELLVQCAGSHSLFDPLDYAVFRTVAHHTTDRHPRDRLLPPLSLLSRLTLPSPHVCRVLGFATTGSFDGAGASPRIDTRPLHRDAVTAACVCSVAGSDDVLLATGGKDLGVVISRLNDATRGASSGPATGVGASAAAGMATGTMCNGHSREVTALEWASTRPDLLFSCSRDKTVKQWDLASGREMQTFSGHSTAVAGVTVVSAGTAIVSGGRDGVLARWDMTTGAKVRETRLSQNVVTSLRAVPGTDLLVQASEDKQLRVWDASALKPVLAFPRQQYIQTCCDAATDGNFLLTGSNGFNGHGCFVTLWDRRRANKHVERVAHTQGVNSCVFLPRNRSDGDGGGVQSFCTTSMDGSLKLWRGVDAVELAVNDLKSAGGSQALAATTDDKGCPLMVVGTVSGAVPVLRCYNNSFEPLGYIVSSA